MKKRKKKRWALLEGILGKIHLSTVVGFLVSLTVAATIIVLLTGAVYFYVSMRNSNVPKDPPPIVLPYNP
jgi:uncharacterized membrane protein YdcZ (DUF606 family)